MGRFYREITVSRGLPPDLRHLKGALRKRKRLVGRRTIDESSVVEVNEWRLRHTPAYGALTYLIVSCNISGNLCVDEGRWGRAIVNRVDRRMKLNDGFAKGRALFLVGEDFWEHRTAVAVILLHIPREGVIEILVVETARDIWPERHDVFVGALLVCCARVARESGAGDLAILRWTVPARRLATDICRRYKFTEETRDSKGYHLVRRFDYTRTESADG